MSVEVNIKALKRLRGLPKGHDVDSRVNAIKSLLNESEALHTFRSLRWPQGVVCPRCHSHNTVLRPSPDSANDDRQFYECLNCKGQGLPSLFDDLTGIVDIDSINELQQWILCWYLIGICSVHQVAQITGLSYDKVMKIASMLGKITLVSKELDTQALTAGTLWMTQKKLKSTEKKQATALDELRSKSASIGKFKPGPKSKL